MLGGLLKFLGFEPNVRVSGGGRFPFTMIRFAEMLNEDHAGKNLHLEHLEDEIINNGVAGGRAMINFLRSLRDMQETLVHP